MKSFTFHGIITINGNLIVYSVSIKLYVHKLVNTKLILLQGLISIMQEGEFQRNCFNKFNFRINLLVTRYGMDFSIILQVSPYIVNGKFFADPGLEMNQHEGLNFKNKLNQKILLNMFLHQWEISVRINLPLFSTVLPSNSCCFCPVGLSLSIQHFQQLLLVSWHGQLTVSQARRQK